MIRRATWLLFTSIPAACVSATEPLSAPSIDVTGMVTLATGAPGVGLTIGAISYEGACAFPPLPRTKPFRGASATTDRNGVYRVRVPADTLGVQCVQVSAEVDGARATERKPGVARDERPLATVRIDLVLR